MKLLDLKFVSNKIYNEILRIRNESKTEEDFKIRFTNLLNDFIRKFIQEAKFEHNIISGRADAVLNKIIIEFKKPRILSSNVVCENSIEQIIKYISEYCKKYNVEKHKIIGIITDGFKIIFVRYRRNFDPIVLDISENSIYRLLSVLLSSQRIPISPKYIIRDFGHDSFLYKKAIRILYKKLDTRNPKVEMLFSEWKKMFSLVCSYNYKKLKDLERELNIGERIDVEKLLFVIHTYYSLIIKFLVSEVLTFYFSRGYIPIKSFSSRIIEERNLKYFLKKFEEKGLEAIFPEGFIRIVNFLEGDFFAWYVEVIDKELEEILREMAEKIYNYDPATIELQPENVKDLFKKLYQNLVPKKIRHDLGEYYTPDWLAELLFDEIGYDGNPDIRILDPACGSGTFLIEAIKRVKQYSYEENIDDDIVARKILENIIGFDLNPLAVITARANYLIAIADILYHLRGNVEIPIYLTDSLLASKERKLFDIEYTFKLYNQEIKVPENIAKNSKIFNLILSLVKEYLNYDYSPKEFQEILKRETGINNDAKNVALNLYKILYKLKLEKRDMIWINILRNIFAPFRYLNSFDIVIGNPPWINWENIAEGIRGSLKKIVEEYGISPRDDRALRKMDISYIFLYRVLDLYLKDKGILAFLINQTCFKGVSGEGFRKMKLYGKPIRVLKVHDMVDLQPFEDASNRTGAIIVRKNDKR